MNNILLNTEVQKPESTINNEIKKVSDIYITYFKCSNLWIPIILKKAYIYGSIDDTKLISPSSTRRNNRYASDTLEFGNML